MGTWIQDQSSRRPPTGQATEGGDLGPTKVAYQLSGPLTAFVGSAFLSGVWYGLVEFVQRSSVRQLHVAGTAAWGEQLSLALATVVIVSIAQTRHRRRFGPRSGRPWLLAPFGRHAAQRLGRALGFGGERAQAGRLLLALPAAALFLFCFWRAGVQVTAGLDPNCLPPSPPGSWTRPYPQQIADRWITAVRIFAANAGQITKRCLPENDGQTHDMVDRY